MVPRVYHRFRNITWWVVFGIGFFLATNYSVKPMEHDDLLLRKLETVRTAADVQPVLEEIIRALRNGRLFGREIQIARLTRRFWQDTAIPSAIRLQLQKIYEIISPAVVAQDSSVAQTLLVDIPLSWLASDNSDLQRLTFPIVRLAWMLDEALQRRIAEVLPVVLEQSAAYSEELFETIIAFLAETKPHLSSSFPAAFLNRLRSYRGPHAWNVPEILALDTTETGTNTLIAWAIDPPPLPPDARSWLTRDRWRRLFLEKLEQRTLTLEQKQKVVGLLSDPELQQAMLRLVRLWWYRKEALPSPPPETLSLLETLVLQGESCAEAVRLLAADGVEGIIRLFRMVTEDMQDWDAAIRSPRPCEWDRWSALFEHAAVIADRVEQAYRTHPAPWHVQLLAAAGRWELVLEALQAPVASLRQQAALLLSLALAPEEEEAARLGNVAYGQQLAQSLAGLPDLQLRIRKALQQALQDKDPAVYREALRALLQLGDETASRALRAALQQEDRWFQTFISGFRPKLTTSLALQLVHIAQDNATTNVIRRRAIELLRLAKPDPWRNEVEPFLRSPLRDADPLLRRAAAEYFASIPAQNPGTTADLLAVTRDASEYVRHAAASALAIARSWTPKLVEHLRHRLEEGDPDENVEQALEVAYLHALRHEPGAVDQLLKIIISREGPSRWRRALAEGPPADSIVARMLLHRLAAYPPSEWAPLPSSGIGKLDQFIASLVHAEEDPPSLIILTRLITPELLDPWLVQYALTAPDLSLSHRLWLLQLTSAIPKEFQDTVFQLWTEALLQGEGLEWGMELLKRWEFAGVQRLIAMFWNRPEALHRVWQNLRKLEAQTAQQGAMGFSGTFSLPKPSAADLPWIEAMLARIPAGVRDPRLTPLVHLAGIWYLGNHPALRKAAFRTRIPALLLRHIADPVDCSAVAEAVGSLFGRQPPPCN